MDPEKIVSLLEPSADMIVIDLATGGGATARAIAPFVSAVSAIDSCSEAIESCAIKNGSAGITNIQPQVMDVEELLFPDGLFDAATCRLAMHHFDDLEGSLTEIARVLRNGAPLIIADRLCPDDDELSEFLHCIGRLRDNTFRTVLTKTAWKELLEKCGFRLVSESIFKETIDIDEWLNHSPLDDEEKAAIQAAFMNASSKVQDYFQVQIEDVRAAKYTDDKIMIRAEKIQKNRL